MKYMFRYGEVGEISRIICDVGNRLGYSATNNLYQIIGFFIQTQVYGQLINPEQPS